MWPSLREAPWPPEKTRYHSWTSVEWFKRSSGTNKLNKHTYRYRYIFICLCSCPGSRPNLAKISLSCGYSNHEDLSTPLETQLVVIYRVYPYGWGKLNRVPVMSFSKGDPKSAQRAWETMPKMAESSAQGSTPKRNCFSPMMSESALKSFSISVSTSSWEYLPSPWYHVNVLYFKLHISLKASNSLAESLEKIERNWDPLE